MYTRDALFAKSFVSTVGFLSFLDLLADLSRLLPHARVVDTWCTYDRVRMNELAAVAAVLQVKKANEDGNARGRCCWERHSGGGVGTKSVARATQVLL